LGGAPEQDFLRVMAALLERTTILTPYGKTTWLPLVAALAAAGVFCALWFPWGLVIVLPPLAFVLWFFRDPERRSDAPENALISPADGQVVEIAAAEEPEFLKTPATRISIFMSVVSVHVNRAPCDATVEWVKPLDGTFLNAMRAESGLENVRTLIALRRPDGSPLLVKQVAGLIARRIICPLKPGDRLRRGQRFGMIKFGSRVEIFLPRDKAFDPQVRLGQFVKAGETTLGVWR